MNRDKALERLSALETEAKELRMIITAPEEPDYSQWIGKYGFFSDSQDPPCIDNMPGFLLSFDQKGPLRFLRKNGAPYRYFRPATAEELGFAGPEPDWSKAPEWARYWTQNAGGTCRFHERLPMRNEILGYWTNDGSISSDTTACPNWRDSRRERPV